MDNHGISLRKETQQPWTDPVTGEIYPGGNPNIIPQPRQTTAPSSPTMPTMSAMPTAQPQSFYQQPVQSVRPEQPVQPVQQGYSAPPLQTMNDGMKFCKFCGGRIPFDAVVCTYCGRQVEELRQAQPQQIVINNSTNNNNNNQNYAGMPMGRQKNKWVAVLLCFFFGIFGVHRFYEGKIGTGLLWLFTFGLFGIGDLVDFIILLTKPNPYYV